SKTEPVVVSCSQHSVHICVIVIICIPKLRLILILNSCLESSDRLVFSELVHSLADRLLSFFFSSRRRHTRLQGDWSSDVCSSDLARACDEPLCDDPSVQLTSWVGSGFGALRRQSIARAGNNTSAAAMEVNSPMMARSEERRVGKECRCRWSPDVGKKKEIQTREQS